MLELTFITSSNVKLNHAIHLCRDYTVNIVGYKKKYYGKGYEEPRIHERDELLKRSIEDALERWKKNISKADEKFFFIEDTSVIIHSLSHKGIEVPGVDIKYWMQENDFYLVDQMLKQHDNDRRVTVRSDVLLMLTSSLKREGEESFVRFSSKINGTIVDHEYDIKTNPVCPWLDNKTFNKWFVPDGCDFPISMLDITEADRHDFRAGAFQGMLNFLVNNKQIQHKDTESSFATMTQAGLPIGTPLFIVSGPTCAGKTTLAEYLINSYGYYHIEASDFMYLNYYNKLGIGSSITISEFAKQVLKQKPDIVVNEIIEFMGLIQEWPVIITGLRTATEIDAFLRKYKGSYLIEIVTVNAEEEVRLSRYLARNRGGSATKEKFYIDSKTQDEMGLSSLIDKYSGNVFDNNGTLDEYYNKFVMRYESDLLNVNQFAFQETEKIRPRALEDAILISLFINDSDYLTTTEIAKLINKTYSDMNIEKSKNNVSRYFNQCFYPYFEATRENNVNKYRLSQTGRMHAQWLLRRKQKPNQ
jgi:dephospho-CoA kinase